ncbi:unnamed protein product [Calypogeia fissa]
MQKDHGEKNGGRHPPDKGGYSNVEGRDNSALPAGARVERAEKGYLGASEAASGISSRTSPITHSPGPDKISSKSVAFSKPTSTVIPAEVSQGGAAVPPNPVASSSANPREGQGMGKNGSYKDGSNIPGPPGQSLARFGPRLRAEGLMVPPASDAATLRRQVAALQIDLEAHIDGEQRLQSINQQLRERLELYMKQNHENVERAESELNILHEDMEQTLELQRRLAQRATALEKEKKDMEQILQKRLHEFEEERVALQDKISSMSEDLRGQEDTQSRVSALQAELNSTQEIKERLEEQLRKYGDETEHLKRQAENYSQELNEFISKEQKKQEVEKLGQKAQLRRQFSNFKEGIVEQSVESANEQAAEEFCNAKSLWRGLRALRLAVKRAKHMRHAFENKAQETLATCFKAWRMGHVVGKKQKESLEKRSEGQLIHAWHSWKSYSVQHKIHPQLNQIAHKHWKGICLKRMMNHWREVSKQNHLSPEDERRLTLLSRKHWHLHVYKRALKRWLQWLKCWARPKRKKLASVQAHINHMTIKQALSAWRGFVRGKWVKRMKFEQACIQEEQWCRRRGLQRLKNALKEIWYRRRRADMAVDFRRVRLRQVALRSWRMFVQRRRHGLIAKQMAFRHYLHDLRAKAIHIWRDNVAYLKAKMRATMEVNEALMRAAMVFWKDYHGHHAIKKKKLRTALVNKARREIKMAKLALQAWWEQMAWKRRALQLDTLMAIRRRRTLMIVSLHNWMHATFDGLLIANSKLQDELMESQAQHEEQKHQVTAVDVENLQLIDRLHTMSSEIAFLKTTINEKEKQVEELHRALEDSAVLESSMRGEIEQQHVRSEELEVEIQSLQKKLQMKNAEDTAGEVHHTLEVQNLGQSIKELRHKVAEKDLQIDAYEKALKETAEKLEGATDESQEKLTSAFEIAASLRKLLEERENQYATLEGNCRRRELELGEVQRKLAVANCTLCETVEARDARIVELESLLSRKHLELQESQQHLQELELIMDCKDSRVRKLEYENKLMAEQTSSKTKNYVSTWAPSGPGDPNALPIGGLHKIQDDTEDSLRRSHEMSKDSPGSRRGHDLSKDSLGTSSDKRGSPDKNNGGYLFYSSRDSGNGRDSGRTSTGGRGESRTPGGRRDRRSHDSAESMHDDRETHPGTSLERHLQQDSSRSRPLNPSSGTAASTDDNEGGMEEPGGYQTDWETSFALVSTARPPSHGSAPEASGAVTESHQDWAGSGEGSGRGRTSADGPFRMVLDEDPGAVDSLHVEIQRLQARIMSRMKDSPSQGEEGSPSGSRPSHGSSGSSRQRRDSRDSEGRRRDSS